MAFMYWFGMPFLLSVWSTSVSAQYTDHPDGVFDMECHDRYFMMAVDLSFSGNELRFEAVDSKGVYPITEQYQALCGYSINVLPMLGQAEIRASYFSCHAEKDDEKFVFKFNLIATHEGQEVIHTVNKTCSPSLPWSPREVSCEVNYMEISVRSDQTCPSRPKTGGWNDVLTAAYVSAASDWQVLFQNQGKLSPITIAEARKQGYMFEVTGGRLVFRAPYGQPHSFTAMVDGVDVEVVHATLFSRNGWVVLMVDLLVACSMDGGSYSDGNVVWRTPLVFAPLESGVSEQDGQRLDMWGSDGQLNVPELDMWGSDGHLSRELSVWVNGQLLKPDVVKERGYVMEETNTTLQISIPYYAEGGRRKSLVLDNVYHTYFVFYLYFEHLFEDEDHVETRFRLLRRLVTPPLSQPAFSVNQTVLEERMFTVYLGPFPGDVEMVAVKLTGHHFAMPSHYISNVVYPNNTHGYTLSVPFEDSVSRQFYKWGVLQYRLDINCSLMILPERLSYYHLASVEALMTGIFPPAFEGFCSEKAISFKVEHKPFHSLWRAYVGPDPLTPDLAFEKGYVMNNNSQSLHLTVPLFRAGYTYKNVCLKKFSGSFEITIRDAKTLDVQDSFVMTCTFPSTELVVCSTDGLMTVVADLYRAIPTGGNPSRSTLLDGRCGPKEADGTRVLFSFALGSCGSSFKLDRGHAIYENQIVLNQKLLATIQPDMVTVRCVYPLSGLHRLFLLHRFESEFPGVGTMRHSSTKTPDVHMGGSTKNGTRTPFSSRQPVKHFGAQSLLTSKLTPRTMLSAGTPRHGAPIKALPASALFVRRDPPPPRDPYEW